jgi:hypothetical protein
LKNVLKYGFYTISIILAIAVAVPQSNCYAQNKLRILEEPGGGSQPTQSSSNTDNTFIYVAGGLLVAGILAYALLVKKDKKEDTDTTNVSMAAELINNNLEEPFSEVVRAKENLPVDIFFGIRNDEAVLQGKTYLLGVSFKL